MGAMIRQATNSFIVHAVRRVKHEDTGRNSDGYGSIPIDTFLGDEHPFTSYIDVNYRGIGFDPSPDLQV